MEFKITPILNADQLLDKAFGRASKIEKRGKDKVDSKKKTASMKLNSISDILEDTLKRYEKEFPSIDRLPEFYYEIIDITVGVDKLKNSLGALNWARRRIKRTLMESARELMKKEEEDEINRVRKKAYARTDSFLNQIDDDLEFLEDARKKLNSLPDIRTDEPTVAVAGYPNVGKSELVTKISSGKPKVAVYPFTTQEVGIGHFYLGYQKCQLIDTPGLLDRPEEERNKIEMQAVKALESLADIIIYIYDPTETCGYPIEAQEALYKEIKNNLSEVQFIDVENKSDINISDSDRLKISALNEDNLDDLKEKIKELLEDKYPIEKPLSEDIHYLTEPKE